MHLPRRPRRNSRCYRRNKMAYLRWCIKHRIRRQWRKTMSKQVVNCDYIGILYNMEQQMRDMKQQTRDMEQQTRDMEHIIDELYIKHKCMINTSNQVDDNVSERLSKKRTQRRTRHYVEELFTVALHPNRMIQWIEDD